VAKIYLETDDNNFIIANTRTSVFGSDGVESIVINSNVRDIQINSLIEGVKILGSSSDFTYQSRISSVKVFQGNELVVFLAANANVTVIFNDGAVKLTASTLTGEVYLGETMVPFTKNDDIVPEKIFKLSGNEYFYLDSSSVNKVEPQILNIGEKISGLMYGKDRDWFSVELLSDLRYVFEVSSKDINNPAVGIYDSSNRLLAKQVGDEPLTFRPVQSGKYYLVVEDDLSTANYFYMILAEYERFNHTLNFTNPVVFGEHYNKVVSNIRGAIDQWANKIIQTGNSSATIDVNIVAQDSNKLGGAVLAAARNEISVDGGEILNGNVVFYSGLQHEILTGEDANAFEADASLFINSDLLNSLWFDPTPNDRFDNRPMEDEYDFLGVMMHEFSHALGFNGYLEYLQSPVGGQGINQILDFGISRFDSLIEWNNNLQQFEYIGSKTDGVYNQLGLDGHLPLYSEGNKTGSDLYHYGASSFSGTDVLDGYLMNADAKKGEVMTIALLDLAIFQDIGYFMG